MTCFYYKRGMSLVEVLIVVSIVALMAAISFSFLGGSSKDQVFLENACNEFVGVVNNARAKTLASSGSFPGEVKFTGASSDYASFSGYSGSLPRVPLYTFHTLPKGVVFSSNGSVTFTGVDANCAGCSTITLKRSAMPSSTKNVVFKGQVASCQ